MHSRVARNGRAWPCKITMGCGSDESSDDSLEGLPVLLGEVPAVGLTPPEIVRRKAAWR